MRRKILVAAAVMAFLIFAPVVFGQDDRGQPDPPASNEIIGPQLIAWSDLQEPKPLSPSVPASHQSESWRNQESAQIANTSNRANDPETEAESASQKVKPEVENPKRN
jgi:hypothetical protein